MSRVTNAAIMEAINAMTSRFDSIESRLTALETAQQSQNTPATQKKTKSSSKKAAPKKTKSSSNTFDRALYESTARRLGVFNEKYGKVTATVKDGKVVATAQQNRQKVYDAMGL